MVQSPKPVCRLCKQVKMELLNVHRGGFVLPMPARLEDGIGIMHVYHDICIECENKHKKGDGGILQYRIMICIGCLVPQAGQSGWRRIGPPNGHGIVCDQCYKRYESIYWIDGIVNDPRAAGEEAFSPISSLAMRLKREFYPGYHVIWNFVKVEEHIRLKGEEGGP